MLTKTTQDAICLLRAIGTCNLKIDCSEAQMKKMFDLFEQAKIIGRKEGEPKYKLNSYEFIKPRDEISLLDILETTGEHLDCNHLTAEEFYLRYGKAGRKLGVVNQMTRLYLQEIKLIEL